MSNTIFHGQDEVIANFTKAGDKVGKAAATGVFEGAGIILQISRNEVPHDTGHLMNTGNVSELELDANKNPMAHVGYNTPYAARLHEHPEYHFQKGRKGKFLEDPMKINEARIINYIMGMISNAMGGL